MAHSGLDRLPARVTTAYQHVDRAVTRVETALEKQSGLSYLVALVAKLAIETMVFGLVVVPLTWLVWVPVLRGAPLPGGGLGATALVFIAGQQVARSVYCRLGPAE